MTGLLEFREKLKEIYSHNEFLILPLIKFLGAFLTLNIINEQMGYMTKVDNIALVLIVALMCSFLPNGAIVFFAAVFSLLHMYALAMEVALIGLIVYVLLFLLFFRFGPKDSVVVVITPILCMLNIPYVVPVAMGLLGTPASAVTVACGVVVYYLIMTITGNASAISTMGEDVTARIRLVVDGLIGNKSMMVMAAAFAITVIVVYLIRRMSIDYSWSIAIVAGVMLDLVILLIGDLIYDTNVSVVSAILGAVLAIVVAKIIEFFRFCVDYSRTEKVQFEDDEYYYYVKAVPKMTVAAPTKTVKKINTQTRSAAPSNRTASHSGSGTRPTGRPGGAPAGRSGQSTGGRTVVTERTGAPRGTSAYGQSAYGGYKERLSGGKSVTISSDNMTEDAQDDYEELF